MREDHRREFTALEGLAASIRERCGLAVDDCVSLERLISLYVRLAVAHRQVTTLLELPSVSDDAIMELVHRAGSAEIPVRAALQRRLDILHRRWEGRRVARAEQLAIEHELATVAETVRWTYERIAMNSNSQLREELKELLESRDDDVDTLRELRALREEGGAKFDEKLEVRVALPAAEDDDVDRILQVARAS
jgi:hypothetical protein